MGLFIGILIGLSLGAPIGMLILALVSVNHGAPECEDKKRTPPQAETQDNSTPSS